MPSSISSSERRLPSVPWLAMLAAGVAIFLMGAVLLEARLEALGYRPTALDSRQRWQQERTRAAELGEHALILVGASRFQLGIDLDVLRRETGLEPVQLALDGSAGEPVLTGLADDPRVRGTILFDYYDHAVGARGGVAEEMEQAYGRGISYPDLWRQPAAFIEGRLTTWAHERLRAYADGADPLTSLHRRALPAVPARQYLITRPDRSRLADYTLVDMPEFYYRRVARTLGEDVDVRSPHARSDLAHRISRLMPAEDTGFAEAARRVGGDVARIRARGGRVIFVAMPSSGMVREIEMRRYPRERFWTRFLMEVGAPGIHAAQEGPLGEHACPDGSHLDLRERGPFTRSLAAILRQRGLLPSGS